MRICSSEEELSRRLEQLLNNQGLQQAMGRMGRQRMGPAGGSDAIAQQVIQQLAPER